MKCVVIIVTYMVKLKETVLAPWSPLSISAVPELVLIVVLLLQICPTFVLA